MPEKQNSMPILLPSKGWQHYFIRALYSISNFAKASILSIIILVVILLLLSRMEQAYTMLLRMFEDDKFSLALCFLMVNLLAISLSHYPIYTYYAGNLNGSRDYIQWHKKRPFKVPVLRWITIYTYTLSRKGNYVKDIYANVLRNYLGLFIFVIWIHLIFSTYAVTIQFYMDKIGILTTIVYSSLFLPFIIYWFVKRKLSTSHSTVLQRKRIYKITGIIFFIVSMLTIVSFTLVLVSERLFSFYGLVLMLVTTYLMMWNYVLYRLVRPRMYHIFKEIKFPQNAVTSLFLKITKNFGYSENYLLVFKFAFYACFLAIIYFNLASLNLWKLPNGLSIVLIYLYFYFYIISSIGKFYFVYFSIAQKQNINQTNYALDKRSFKWMTSSIILFVILFVIGQFLENSLNNLQKYPISKKDSGINPNSMINRFQDYGDTVYFVNSHGGGLKSSSWTLKVLQELQVQSGGRFLEQTVAMSGASGGSVGLALYGDLMGTHHGDLKKIESVIENIEKDNFASVDISMVMGLDFIRNIFPLNQFSDSKDRSYYAMLRYQNHIQNNHSNHKLSETTFKKYWNQLETKGKVKLPILIMNTSSTSGRRGIFCTLDSDEFNYIFPYAKDLGEFKESGGKKSSVSFYQAVSTTNRFPIFSPAAKIEGSGHYIDAGAIDNSGILGCFDLFLYFEQNGKFANKKVVFVDINNSKTAYAEYLLADFISKNPNLLLKINESEKSSIVANIQTGFNLSKIPGYLRDFMKKYVRKKPNVSFKQVFLPYKIGIKDIEEVIDANLHRGQFYRALETYLNNHNNIIKSETEYYTGFFSKWKYYDPVLSNSLSKSNIAYFNKMRSSSLNGINNILGIKK